MFHSSSLITDLHKAWTIYPGMCSHERPRQNPKDHWAAVPWLCICSSSTPCSKWRLDRARGCLDCIRLSKSISNLSYQRAPLDWFSFRQEDVARYLQLIVPPVLACFTDQDARVRYYACEAMYNIAKVAKGEILVFFNDIFDTLCKVCRSNFRSQLYFSILTLVP
jgi:hypothetical protein